MPNLLQCPHCGQEITIPEGIDPSEPLCCPICDAEFTLSEVVSDETPPSGPVSDEIPLADVAEEAPETGAVGSEAELEPAEPESDAAAFASWAQAAEGEGSNVESEVPEPEVESLELAPEVPEPEVESLELAPDAPEPETAPLDLTPEAPEPEVESLDLIPEVPEPEADSLDLIPEVPEPEAESLDLIPEVPESEAESLDLIPEVPEPEAEPVALTPKAPEPEAETFELAAEPPKAAAETETYALAGEAPQGEAAIPGPQPEIPKAEAEAAGATLRTVKAKAEDLKARVETLLADVSALEAELGGVAGERPQLDVWKQVGAAPSIDTGESGTAAAETGAGTRPAHTGAFDFGADQAAEGGAATATGVRPRPKKKKRSAFFTILEWVFGGVAGLLIAYYAINFIRGESGNFLEVPLPGVPHTYKHCPAWWPGWLKPWAGEEDSDPQQDPASKASGNPARPAPGELASVATRPGSSTPASPAESPPKTFPPGYVGLANPPSYAPADLGTALKAAHASVGCPKCNSTGKIMQDGEEVVCPDCQGNPPEGLMPSAYAKFCHLAEVVTFLDDAAEDPQTGPRKLAIADLLEKLGRDPATVDKVGFEAGKLCAPQNRDGNGVLLTGIVQRAGPVGNANATHLQLAISRRTVIVVTKEPLPVQPQDDVFILGSFVDDPPKNLIGFETSQPLVVWGGMAVKREE